MQPFMEAGLDSLGATELQASLEAAFGMDLPATATIDHPTSAALAAYITSLLSGLHAPAGNHFFIFPAIAVLGHIGGCTLTSG